MAKFQGAAPGMIYQISPGAPGYTNISNRTDKLVIRICSMDFPLNINAVLNQHNRRIGFNQRANDFAGIDFRQHFAGNQHNIRRPFTIPGILVTGRWHKFKVAGYAPDAVRIAFY